MPTSVYPKFFITHSWRDNKFAQRLTDDLKAKGLQGFFDVYSIQPGDNIPSRISQGLEDCDAYIPILSEPAFSSPWCEWELGAAIQLRNTRGRMGRPRIIPILIDHCGDKIPAILRPVAYVDFSDSYAKGFNQLLVRGLGIGGVKIARASTPAVVPAKRAAAVPVQSTSHPVLLVGIVVAVVAVVLLGTLFLGGTTTEINPLAMVPPSSLTSAAAARSTASQRSSLATTSKSSSISSALIVLPTSVPTQPPPPPPASIDNPMCPEPQYTVITFPTNGGTVSGVTPIRGSAIVRPFAQPYRYSLFYRAGIVRDAMDVVADAQVPLSPTSPNGKNLPIQVVYFQPYDNSVVDSVLGYWDTSKLTSDWYSLRLWNKDRGGNLMGCDVYVYVK